MIKIAGKSPDLPNSFGSAGGVAGGGKDKTGIKGTLLSYSILQYQIFLLVLGNLREMLHLKQFSDSLSR